MKKTMVLVLCLVLILSMALTGCGSEKDKLIGSWEGEVDMTGLLNDSLSAQDPEMGEYLRVSEFALICRMTFNADDTYSFTVDRAALDESFSNLKKDVTEGITAYLEYILYSQNVDMTVEDFLAATGQSVEALVEASFPQDMVDRMCADVEMAGTFAVSEGKLMLSETLDAIPDSEMYENYTLEGNKLIITKETSTVDDPVLEYIYPMILTKVK